MTRKNIIFDANNVIKPLCIKLSQMIGYVKHFDIYLRFSQCYLRLMMIKC